MGIAVVRRMKPHFRLATAGIVALLAAGSIGCGSPAEPEVWQECCCSAGASADAQTLGELRKDIPISRWTDAVDAQVDSPGQVQTDAHTESDAGSVADSAANLESGTCPIVLPKGHRVMPFGDSITNGDGSPGGWRVRYWQLAQGLNPPLDFVGSMSNGPANLPDKSHEGHSGRRIDELDSLLQTGEWIKDYQPDVVLLMAGANDMIQNYQVDQAHLRLRQLILTIHEQGPQTWIVVGSTTVINEVGAEARAKAFNALLPGVIEKLAEQCVPVRLLDMHPVLTVAMIDSGGVHPTAAGYDTLGAAWFDGSKDLLGPM